MKSNQTTQKTDYHDLRIIFMGTPEFAVASLNALVLAGCNVVAVVTAPDKPAGRGMQLQEPAVKKYAKSKDIPVLQPEKLRSPEFIDNLRQLKADLQVVVAFRMLPEIVWNMAPMGTVNVHGSLLPQYRGAAPINWAIINGEKITGITTFKLKHEIDTGNILLQEKLAINEDDNAGTVHDRMKELGARLLVETVIGLASGELKEKPQPDQTGEDISLHHAPRIFTETCRINWKQSIENCHNLIRGLSPYPGAFTELEGKTLKIFAATKEFTHPLGLPGSFETDRKTYLKFAATDGYLHLTDLQLQGKKRLPIGDFLRGYRFSDNV
ncbi:methionyl-tRNA formyltransferase [Flavihumibacter sp. ZG627]|uniref:methionyl-tRNA formyltransferase n=1 Tax=Flavihumibacter sp. ZG627 TaxID=1463156 RepID=UPI000693B361|nr:methionyl-tRNA formyltransferase [Flavihumibacter sp. ZG627]